MCLCFIVRHWKTSATRISIKLTLKACQDGIGLNVVTQEWCEIESSSLVGWTGIKRVMYKMERKEIETSCIVRPLYENNLILSGSQV